MNNEKEIWDTEHEHLKHFSRSSYEERLNWLEEANEFVRESQIAYSKKNIAFLFGSGISLPAGLPSTRQITEQILSGRGIAHHTDNSYFFGEPIYIPRIPDFINIMANAYFTTEKGINFNYEDIYYVLWQIYQNETGASVSEEIAEFIQRLKSQDELQNFLRQNQGEIHDGWTLLELSDEAIKYIQCSVWRMIQKPTPGDLSYLSLVKDAWRDECSTILNIFTLNHDTLMEQFLRTNYIEFSDGFDTPTNGARYWNNTGFNKKHAKIRFLKLHGSIDWFEFLSSGKTKTGIPESWDYWHTKDSNGDYQVPANPHPFFLTGTKNKPFVYKEGIYKDIFAEFDKALKRTSFLIVSGYGFGDEGINDRIAGWVDSAEGNRLLIIHHDPDKIKNYVRNSIASKMTNWEMKNKLSFINKTIENTSWQEIKGIYIQRT